MRPLVNKSCIFCVVLIFFYAAVTADGKVIYVDADAPGANNGSSWQDAYHYLQDALADANSADKPVEIRVAQGTYKPDQGKNQTPRDREATFQLQNGVSIKGGYAGFAEPDPNARDTEAYETILSGDLASNDGNVNDLRDLLLHPTRIDNSYHVVRSAAVSESAALDGLTITAGNDDRPCPAPSLAGPGVGISSSPPRYRPTPCDMGLGGGVLNANSSPTVIRCTFLENSAMQSGGAVCNIDCNSLSIIDCTFLRNYGCAMCNLNSNPKITNCTFRANVGGGVSNFQSDSNFVRCVFVDNIGGAMHNQNSSIKLTSCLFLRNSVGKYGGGIYNDTSSAELENCTFAKNEAGEEGGGIFAFTFKHSLEHNHHIAIGNTIFWENSSEIGSQIALEGGTVSIEYNVLPEGLNGVHDPYHGIMWGRGNSALDPLFADPNNDLHLKSQAGRWDRDTQSWIQDEVTSPCIDAGDPMSPIGYEPFPNGGLINMGAYGGTAEASKSYFGEPVCETIVAGDMNGDCRVNLGDFAILAAHWLECSAPEGQVQVTDVKIIKGELVEGWFKEIEEVANLRIGDVFLIRVKVSNLGCERVNVLNLYGWDLSPPNYVEVIGDSVACAAVYRLEPGESASLGPFCPSQAFRAKQDGLITMNIYERDWMANILYGYTFNFEILPGE